MMIFSLMSVVLIFSMVQALGQTGSDVKITTGAGAAADASCVAAENCYSPNPLTIKSGTTVIWTNSDKTSHTVTSGKVTDDNTGSIFDSNLVKPGNTFQFTFIGAGTFDYFCSVHPWMVGQIIVTNSIMTNTTTSPMTIISNTASSSIGNLTGPTPGQEQIASNVEPTTNTSAPQQSTTGSPSNTSALTVTEPSTPTTNTESAMRSPSSDTSGAQMAAWGAGIVIFAIVTGIGIWTAVRRR